MGKGGLFFNDEVGVGAQKISVVVGVVCKDVWVAVMVGLCGTETTTSKWQSVWLILLWGSR